MRRRLLGMEGGLPTHDGPRGRRGGVYTAERNQVEAAHQRTDHFERSRCLTSVERTWSARIEPRRRRPDRSVDPAPLVIGSGGSLFRVWERKLAYPMYDTGAGQGWLPPPLRSPLRPALRRSSRMGRETDGSAHLRSTGRKGTEVPAIRSEDNRAGRRRPTAPRRVCGPTARRPEVAPRG